MLPVHATTIRLFLHVLAATVWVGGQLTLAGLVPAVRRLGPDATKAVARQFNRIAWPAFALVVVTGIWNVFEVDVPSASTEYQITLAVKLVLVTGSGLGAAVHIVGRTKVALAVGGAAAAIGAIGALFLGVLLMTG
jgi:putative copper export protein